ncbi:MAG: hypothetical protein RSA14_03785 [Raoultibacter sp.]
MKEDVANTPRDPMDTVAETAAGESAEGLSSEGETLLVAEGGVGEVSSEQRAADEAQAEHDALVAVFDDVRTCSENSTLVEPSRWDEIGLVPDHMTADDFEMFVYEYLEDFLAEEAQAVACIPEMEKPTYRTASRAVGVPLPPEAKSGLETDDASDAVLENSALEDPKASEFEAFPSETSGANTPSEKYVREAVDSLDPAVPVLSKSGKIMIVDGEPMFVEDEEEPPCQNAPIRCEGIAVLQGQHSYYLYSRDYMTDNYAHWSYLAHEDDAVVSLVDCAREESRVYPRPMPAESLKNPPFNMDDEQIAEAWTIIEESGDFPDMEAVSASNDEVYYFSTKYISRAYAQSLAEWASVERQMNM